MALVRLCGLCGAKVPQGQSCKCQKRRHQEYDKARRNHVHAAFYSSAGWKHTATAARARAGYADEYAMMYKGRLERGNVVHHIIPLEDRIDLALDLGNLVCVSAATHDMIHRAYGAGTAQKRDMMERLFAIRGRGVHPSMDCPGGGQKSFFF